MTDVFVSYKSERRPAADHLAAIIRSYGFSVWVDYEGLVPGEGYAERLETKVKEAGAVLVLWCKLAVQSDWVLREATWAKQTGSFIPVLLEETDLPATFQPDHTINLRAWNGAPMDGALWPLLKAIGTRVGRQPQPATDELARQHQVWELYGRPPLSKLRLQPSLPHDNNAARESRRHATRAVCRLELQGHAGAVNSAAFSPNSKHFLTGSSDDTIRVWDSRTGRELKQMNGGGQVLVAKFSTDGQRIVAAGFWKHARVWDASTGRALLQLKGGHGVATSCASFSPDGKRIGTSGIFDKTVKIWDAFTGKEVLKLKGHGIGGVNSINFSPDGTRVLTGGGDKTARVWDAKNGREIMVLKGHSGWVSSAVYSPDGTRILTTSEDGTAGLWDAQSGREILIFNNHIGQVRCAAFTPDGVCAITGGSDKTARVWDTATGIEVVTLKGHKMAVNSVAASADGGLMLSGSDDTHLRLWELE